MAVAIHGAIGFRTIMHEWGGVKGRSLDIIMYGTSGILFALGARAVWAVTFS